MSDCIFCKIIDGDIPAERVYEDDKILAFRDINPKASVHVLVIPKAHIASLNDITGEHTDIIAHITLKLQDIAKELKLIHGFRTIINTGPGGGQEVFHLHYHILGGERMPGFA